MKKLLPVTILFIALFDSSCVPLKKLERNDLLRSENNHHEPLNGSFRNHGTKTKGNYTHSLWYELNYNRRDTFKAPENSTVTLEVLGNTKLKAVLKKDSMIIKTVVLSGKYQEGYFSVKRYYSIVPIPFIYFRHDDHKIRIGKTQNGHLVVDAAESHSGWILLMAAGNREQYDLQFYPVK
jgi:hypothetical protein